MRRTLLAGGLVAVAAVVAMLLGAAFNLEIESVALLGAALGAVIALVPDGRPGYRLIGFVTGVVAALVVYLLRAGVLPDSLGGRVVAILVVLAICVAVAAASGARVPLWATLVGVGAFVGAYEAAYVAAPAEAADTAISHLTMLLFPAALGFLAASFLGVDGPDRALDEDVDKSDTPVHRGGSHRTTSDRTKTNAGTDADNEDLNIMGSAK